MNPLLQRIVETTRRDLEQRREDTLPRPRPRDQLGFAATLRDGRSRGQPALVAEVKPRSPSRGDLRSRRELGPVLEAYGQRADAVSVLVDAPFFGGGYDLLAEVRRSLSQPILAKGFVVDRRQVEEAAAFGADAVLLIARLLDDRSLAELLAVATDRGLDALIEVHDAKELERAVALSPPLIGVNARDLDTLAIDLAAARQLLARVPADLIRVAESGLERPEDVAAVKGIADACLIGTAFMSAPEPAVAMEALGW